MKTQKLIGIKVDKSKATCKFPMRDVVFKRDLKIYQSKFGL